MGSKKKQVVQEKNPTGRHVAQSENPTSFYQICPSWTFNSCDTEMWGFSENNIGDLFWKEILPFLKGIETQKWQNILTKERGNHFIEVRNLTKCARDRLVDLHIEWESIISLRVTGKHRLYGYIANQSFRILWFDTNHGDNETCVCRSNLKHT